MSDVVNLFKMLFDSSKLPMLLINEQNVLQANQESLNLFSKQQYSNTSLVDKPLSSICAHTEDFLNQINATQSSENSNFEWILTKLDGEEFRARVNVVPSEYLNASGFVLQVKPIVRSARVPNITSYQQIFELSNEAVLVTDTEFNIQYVNPRFEARMNVSHESLIESSVLDMVLLDGNPPCGEDIQGGLDEQNTWLGPLNPLVKKSDSVRYQLRFKALFEAGLLSGYLITLLEEQSKPSQSDQSKLHHLAYHDELTGLSNRALFQQMLEHEINRSHRHGNKFAVLFIDLDRFKQVNDSLGHDAGDKVLCEVADRLKYILRKSDVIARRGGDEFVVILNQLQDSEVVAGVVDKLIREISKPISMGTQEANIGCSVGISLFPDNGETSEALLQHADIAMYRAKNQGGKSYFYFSDEMSQEINDQLSLENMLRLGIERSEFVPFYQPILDVRSGETIGLECLARWQPEDKGTLNPIEFLPVLKKMGLLHKVFLQIMEKSIADLCHWKEQYHIEIPLSVNISSQQFCAQETFEQMASMLDKSGLKTGTVNIDITESTLQENGDCLIEKLRWVQDTGFCVALDDFGTGYSSVKYLQELPLDTLKIDRSFIRNIENNPHDKVIIKAIIQLSKTLDIEVTAEGVETKEQKEFLERNDCFLMQGFYFSPAVEAQKIPQLVLEKNLRRAS
ncbi:EAL domain-containing protein [Alteromonadaceae bacterium M269]|nr:EAL domain-containing protein [Alteromonadaceae bacterium M269]